MKARMFPSACDASTWYSCVLHIRTPMYITLIVLYRIAMESWWTLQKETCSKCFLVGRLKKKSRSFLENQGNAFPMAICLLFDMHSAEAPSGPWHFSVETPSPTIFNTTTSRSFDRWLCELVRYYSLHGRFLRSFTGNVNQTGPEVIWLFIA